MAAHQWKLECCSSEHGTWVRNISSPEISDMNLQPTSRSLKWLKLHLNEQGDLTRKKSWVLMEFLFCGGELKSGFQSSRCYCGHFWSPLCHPVPFEVFAKNTGTTEKHAVYLIQNRITVTLKYDEQCTAYQAEQRDIYLSVYLLKSLCWCHSADSLCQEHTLLQLGDKNTLLN